jgi:OFA family oxalate/formate antiporter-like MFS transporter
MNSQTLPTAPNAPSRQRYITLAAGIAVQLCLGTAYVWSVFQTGVANTIFGGDNAAASLTFSLLLAVLSLVSGIGGKLTTIFSTRAVIMSGGVILGVGFALASLATAENPWVLWLTYGVLGGIGMGFIYSPTIACVQKWFPDKKGLVTGFIVSALGFGGVVFTPVIEYFIVLFGGQGVGESSTFLVLGCIFLVVCTTGGFFMKNPPLAAHAESGSAASADGSKAVAPRLGQEMSPTQMFRQPAYYLITIIFVLACMGGLMMIGFAKPIAVAKGLTETATIGVLLISVFNSAGRLVWGMLSDKFGRINIIMIILIGNGVLSLLVSKADGNWIFLIIGLIGFFYGGLLSNFPSLTADLFGPKHMAANYGFVLLGFGAGAVIASQIAGYYKNLAATDITLMYPAFTIAAVCAAVGLVLLLILKKIARVQK